MAVDVKANWKVVSQVVCQAINDLRTSNDGVFYSGMFATGITLYECGRFTAKAKRRYIPEICW
jgi:hypothetical protein